MTREGLIFIGILMALWVLLNVLLIFLDFTDRVKVILNCIILGITLLVSVVQFIQGVPEPTIYSDCKDGQLVVSIENEIPFTKHFYSTDAGANDEDYLPYSDPFQTYEGTTVFAYSKFLEFSSKTISQIVPDPGNQSPELKFDASFEISGNTDRKFHLEITAPERAMQNNLFPGFENGFIRFGEMGITGGGVGNAYITYTMNDQVTEKTLSDTGEIQNTGGFPGPDGPPEPGNPPGQNNYSAAQSAPWPDKVSPLYLNNPGGYLTLYTPIGDVTVGKDDLRSRLKDGHLEMEIEVSEGTNEFWVDFNMTANGKYIPTIIKGVTLEIYGVARTPGSYALLEGGDIIQKSVVRESESTSAGLSFPGWIGPTMQGAMSPEGEAAPPNGGGMPPGDVPPPPPKNYSIIIPLIPFNGSAQVQIKDNDEHEKFTDIHSYPEYMDAVAYAFGHGLLLGTTNTTFNPNGSVKLSTLVTILHRLEGQPSASIEYRLPDKWYKRAAEWALSENIVQLNEKGEFEADSIVTQRDCLQILWCYDNNRVFEEIDDETLRNWNYQLDLLHVQAIDLDRPLNRAQLAFIIRNYCIADANRKKDAPPY